jgi:hypothetical protein
VLTSSQPAQPATLELLPPPTRSGTGLNIQNLGYAAQWFVFGGFAVFLWVRLLKDEVLRLSGAFDPEEEPAPGSAAEGTRTRADAGEVVGGTDDAHA